MVDKFPYSWCDRPFNDELLPFAGVLSFMRNGGFYQILKLGSYLRRRIFRVKIPAIEAAKEPWNRLINHVRLGLGGQSALAARETHIQNCFIISPNWC